LWHRGPFELMGELAVRRGAHSRADMWGLYVQPVWEVHRDVFLVVRYEHVVEPGRGGEANLMLGGVTLKPRPWLVLQAEYLAADERIDEAPPGFAGSVAILF